MGSTRLLTGAVLSAATLGLAATAAYAGDFGTIEVSPGTAAAGSTVSLSTTGCGASRSASVDATALGGGTVAFAPGTAKGSLVGKVMVKPGTKPGNYGIGGKCADGKELTGTVRVGEQGASAGPSMSPGMSASPSTSPGTGHGSAAPSMPAKEHPSMPAKGSAGPTTPPKGKMKTGEGSTSEDGFNTTEIAAGAGVVVAAAACAVWLVRRRRPGGRY
ncbi:MULTISPECIES: hypothetical protein [Streptomyces]|uniref:hypothetical protein n=1 Tax=Streptomyces TaxID=1883 RepID=UPI00196253B3|nr:MULTISPECIES: hypothetical protein [Streptomyces]QRX91627.1 hypothetical protein JNO44_12945 [Streptomyces noursei]UJB41401.1 hypothetical protein HRD51_11660 [Streptomyces sp. A1-5]